MKLLTFSIVLFVSGTSMLFAQEYFQQEVNYTITVSLNDMEHSLSGSETIQYINNSPDPLYFLYFHLWPNAYRNNTTAFARQQIQNGSTEFYYASQEERGFVDSLDFRANGEKIDWELNKDTIDICRLLLNKPIYPGDTVMISTPFYVKIPGSFSRFGHRGQAYQISQWYPKPAVYDRNGWNQMPYLDQGEFYSEFGSFDVTITLPRNYVVGATGNLVTQEEINWLDQKTKDTTIVNHIPASDTFYKTIRYQENRIHDFAWFADKRYRVLKGEVALPGGKKITTWAMFTDQEADLWKNSLEYINDALRYYSSWYGDYPYNNCSAVYGALEAGGAMEYPTITVVGNAGTPTMLEDFIMHEVGHNWFYGMLGFNERKYPYLDEGINSFSEFRYMKTKHPDLKLYNLILNNEQLARILNLDDFPLSSYYYYSYLMSARSNRDQPMNLRSDEYSGMNYGMVVYHKSALAFNYLLQYLGEEKFDRIMQEFFQQWQFRHPGPGDLQQAFVRNCKEDLSWFFEDVLTTTKKLDYAVKRVRHNQILVKTTGRIASPVSLTLQKEGTVPEVKWFPGFQGKQWLGMPVQSADRVMLLDGVSSPEIRLKNNRLRAHGPLKTVEPLNLNFFQLLEKPDRTQIGIFPAAGWNNYNKTLLGVLFYSPVLPQQTIEYQFMPMYGLGNHDVAGMGRASLNLYPGSSVFQAIQFTADARRFGYAITNGSSYNRLRGEMMITFTNNRARSPLEKTLRFSYTTASEQHVVHNGALFESYFLTLDASLLSHHILNPFGVNFNVEVNNDYTRSSLEMNFARALKYDKKAIQIRLYATGFLNKESDFNSYYTAKLSGASGMSDYRYEHLFLGRFENIEDPNRQLLLSQQFVMSEGGFASNIPYAATDRWLATIGLTLRIPRIPVYLFANAGSYSGAGETTWVVTEELTVSSETVAYEMGAMINLGNVIKVYFPFYTSRDIEAVSKALTGNYWQTIRYIIDLNAINPFKLKNRIF
jgi:hypothetical protein